MLFIWFLDLNEDFMSTFNDFPPTMRMNPENTWAKKMFKCIFHVPVINRFGSSPLPFHKVSKQSVEAHSKKIIVIHLLT